ncbi:hypothetical protein RJ641_024161 [Dillenia turbinata]|uniref:Uncharacterized protein n=1 Tax=Dillenia turbinata TaxID=194707 RepID=A0AAN8U861_9MAGN
MDKGETSHGYHKSNFIFFSCGHIAPPDGIFPVAVSCGPSGQPFDFSYSSRGSSNMIQELGLLLCNLVAVAPEGVAVFFSSLHLNMKDLFMIHGRPQASLTGLRRKGICLENLEEVHIYQSALSDGLDHVMVGLPYPSPFDIELMEGVKHTENLGDVNTAKPQFAVDSIHAGGAIRHINDYAAMLLVYSRYAPDPSKRSFCHPSNKLPHPQWIKDRLVPTTDNYGQLCNITCPKTIMYCLCQDSAISMLARTKKLSCIYPNNGYQKLPKATQFNPLSCGNINPKIHQLDQLQTDFSDHLESGPVTLKRSENNTIMSFSSQSQRSQQDMPSGSYMKKSPVKNNRNGGGREVKKMESFQESNKGFICPPSANGRAYLLAQKIKELEMMDVGNMDHVLDVEEVLHYYSRLTCPAYLDIVDKFFLDMYSELFVSPPYLRD